MSLPTFLQPGRSASPRFFRKQPSRGVGLVLLGIVLLSFLWMGCENTKTYTVTFNTNGGTAIAPQTVAQNTFAKKPTAPTREGFTFENWYSDAGFTELYDFTKTVTANITLYAKWMSKPYTVTFDTGGGSAISPQTVAKNATATKPTNPTRDGFIFENWYSDANFTQAYDFTKKVTADITLYAKWAKGYKVVFNTNGGSAIALKTVAKDSIVAKPADPTKADSTFVNWYSDEALTQLYDFAQRVTADITLYARWAKTYKVMFNTKGGSVVATQTVIKNSIVTKPANPTKADSTFENWYSNEALTQLYDFTQGVTSAITLYAKWTKTYEVMFDANGGTGIDPQTLAKGGTVTKPTDPTKENFIFDNWYSDAALMQLYDFTQGVTSAITLYAKWTPVPTSFAVAAAGAATELEISNTLQFSITNVKPTGADMRVTWSVEGGDGNGTIDTNGLYTAPSTVPTPAQITVKATSVSNATAISTYQITIFRLEEIPDDNFRKKLQAIVPNAFLGDKLNIHHVDVTGLKNLYIRSSSIANLEGIQYFTALDTLSCPGNQLTSLDLSKNTVLTVLICSGNRLTSLDLSKNTALTTLSCNDNELAALDVSKNTALDFFNCAANKLTSLDVSKNPLLTFLTCNNNELTSLDLSKNTALDFFNCAANKLTSLDLRGMRSLRPLPTTSTRGALFIDPSTSTSGNSITTLKVHEKLKRNNRIKEVKTVRTTGVTISWYAAASSSTTYTQSCGDYNPNNDTCSD